MIRTPPIHPAPPADPPADFRAEHVVEGNHLRLLTEGADRLETLIALIDQARTSLRVLYYIFTDDASGRRVRDALTRAAGRGVTVALIVDGFGSDADADFFASVEEAGGAVCRFVPRFGRRYLLRNHQKLVLADEARALIGGFNVEDDYFGDGADAWRDLGLMVHGPAAARIAGYFDTLQAWVRRPRAKLRDLRRILAAGSEDDGRVRWLMGGPTRHLSPWAKEIREEMRGAIRLDMIAAYFAPNPAMLRRVERIAKRGGQARIVTAAKSDNSATIAAARHTYASLLKRGVRVFEYQARKLHTKLYVVDDVTHVGSANFDIRSLYLNCELMLRIDDAAFAQSARAYVEHELAHSREITRADHRRSSILSRIRWTIAYFIVGVVDGNVTRRLNFGLDGR